MAIRRWRVWSVVLAAAVLPAALAHGAATPGAVSTAADFETADPKDLPTLVGIVIKSLPSNIMTRDAAAKAIAEQFTKPGVGVNSKRPEARLNSAILIAGLGNLNSDYSLQTMLKNDDPAVRYYGARGLGPLAPLEKSAAGPTGGIPVRVIKALADAAKVEKSTVVQQEIIRTLIIYEGADALVDADDAITAQMQTQAPDVGTLDIATQALDVITSKISILSPANKSKLPGVAVNAASYAIQHYRQAEKMAKEEGKDVPADLKNATQKLINSAAKAISAGLGKPVNLGTSIDEAELNLNSMFGTPGGAGKVQGVQAPGVIKTGG